MILLLKKNLSGKPFDQADKCIENLKTKKIQTNNITNKNSYLEDDDELVDLKFSSALVEAVS